MAPLQQKGLSALITLLALTPTTLAQGRGGGYGGGGNPYSSGGDGNGDNPFTSGGDGFGDFDFSHDTVVVTAHAVLATLAFALFFPVGGILIRLGSFRGLWLVHGLLQLFAYLLYIAAFGLGIWIITQRSELLHEAHPIIGIVLFALLFFQPFLGFLHHFLFKKHSRRVVWSYGHIWLGRIIITLGIINGGLGLQLAQRLPLAVPSRGAIIAYGVVAGIIWLLYVISIFVGERRRNRAPPVYSKGGNEAVGNKTQYA